MTIAHLLERLERKRDAIEMAITEIRAEMSGKKTRAKAAAIIESVKRGPKKKKHWTQTAKGRRVNALLRSGPREKLHWTQTEAGKKKMAIAQRRAWRARKKANREASVII